MENNKLDFTWQAIVKIIIMVASLYVIYIIKDILIWFLFAGIISIIFNSPIAFLKKWKIPRMLATIFVYVGFFGMISLLIYLVVPLFMSEVQQFIQSFPYYFEKVSPSLRGLGFNAFQSFDTFLESFQDLLNAMSGNVFSGLIVFFGGLSSTLFVIATAFFLSLDEKSIEKALAVLFPKRYEAYVLALFERCEKRVTGWFLVRIIACIFIGVACYVAFLLLSVPYPFTLALFCGVFNFIPYIGSFIAGAGLFLLVFPTEMLKGIFALASFLLIQQIENHIISPILMKRIVGLSPALVLISLALGGKLWGFLGALMAVPLLGIVFEFIKEFIEKKKERESRD
ncbi:MAG: AI-2E family transporter [Candidatus Nealsonbacteria bacterium]|nr:AI-2E family transporter [Candidatus Nealsonbacteria bacterium]